MRSFRRSQPLALSLVLVSFLQAATFEVAQRHPRASDGGPGTAERPWKSISRAAAAVGPGDVVVIRGGVYRERVSVKASGTPEASIRFEAAPGEHVLLTGADRLTDWQKVDEARPIYRLAWPHRFITWNRSMTHPDDEYHRLIGRCEQVIVDGLFLRQVLSADQIAPGAFFADVTNRTLLVWDIGSRDANKLHVEASVRQEVLRVEGDHVELRGVRFRYAANMAQHGAVVLAGRHDTMEDCVVEEISFALHAHDNVIVGNGFAPTAGAWGAQAQRTGPGLVQVGPDLGASRELCGTSRVPVRSRHRHRQPGPRPRLRRPAPAGLSAPPGIQRTAPGARSPRPGARRKARRLIREIWPANEGPAPALGTSRSEIWFLNRRVRAARNPAFWGLPCTITGLPVTDSTAPASRRWRC
jgi:hypothetical protein